MKTIQEIDTALQIFAGGPNCTTHTAATWLIHELNFESPPVKQLAERILLAMAQSTVIEVSDVEETVKRAYSLAEAFLRYKIPGTITDYSNRIDPRRAPPL